MASVQVLRLETSVMDLRVPWSWEYTRLDAAAQVNCHAGLWWRLGTQQRGYSRVLQTPLPARLLGGRPSPHGPHHKPSIHTVHTLLSSLLLSWWAF
jgi:hypothetical protein